MARSWSAPDVVHPPLAGLEEASAEFSRAGAFLVDPHGGAVVSRSSPIILLVLASTLVGGTARAGKKTDLDIQPGPSAMSDAEKAIVADAAKGAQHGVILEEDTSLNDNDRYQYEIAYHLRAKILSAEGRKLADVEVPVPNGPADVKTWWGRTILPDGTSVELAKDSLALSTLVKSAFGTSKVLKGGLPGVVPGCVIDYGYVVHRDNFPALVRILLERDWPVRSLKLRWVPNEGLPAAYIAHRTEGKDVRVERDSLSVLVTASNLAALKREPLMPPDGEVRASFGMYYAEDRTPEEYWTLQGKRIDGTLKLFSSGGAIKDALASMSIPAGAPLRDKLRIAYDWMAANVKNTYLASAEEDEAEKKAKKDTYNAKTVLQAKEGTPRQLDFLFAAMARALGAEAQIVFSTDRTERYWNGGLKSLGQFDYSFVAVRAPGEGDDAWTIVDAGSGLPFGDVPWPATGTMAFMCTSKGWTKVGIPPAAPARNRSDTHVAITFSDDNETVLAKWSGTALGASGMDRRRWLRDLGGPERKKEIDRLCRGDGTGEVVSAELPGLDDATAPYRIDCDIEVGESNLSEGIGRYSLPLTGPWWPPTPELDDAAREYPVIFHYPQADAVSIDVAAPHGFVPRAAPSPVRVDSPYGRYELTVTATPAGFHVERSFGLTPLIVQPPDYPTLKGFVDQVRRADRTTLTFERSGARP